MKKILILSLFLISKIYASEIFILPTKIGETIFNDVLILEKDVFDGPIKGTLTVPGVFSVPIQNGQEHFAWGGIFYNFDIIAKENGEETKIHYALFHYHDARSISGSMTTENGKIIGTIENGYHLEKEK